MSELNKILLNIYSNCIPNKTVLCDEKDLQWMTNGIRAVIEIKNNAYKEYIRSGMKHNYYVRLENLTTEHWNLIRVLNLCQNILVNFENLREHKFRHNFHNILNTLCSCSLDQKTTAYYLLCSHNFSFRSYE